MTPEILDTANALNQRIKSLWYTIYKLEMHKDDPGHLIEVETKAFQKRCNTDYSVRICTSDDTESDLDEKLRALTSDYVDKLISIYKEEHNSLLEQFNKI